MSTAIHPQAARDVKTLRTFDDLVELVRSSEVPLYIRWTNAAPQRDVRLGQSRNHATGRSEAGLSVERLTPRDGRLQPLVAYVAQQLKSYCYIGGRAYVLTGEEVGRGSDGEPVLARPRIVALIDEPNVYAGASRINLRTGEVCRHDGPRESYTAGVVFCCLCDSIIEDRRDLVGVADIARRLGVRPDTVRHWRRRHPDFPAPVTRISGVPAWNWETVRAWASRPRPPGRPRKER